ncbi:vetispiradiene synthase 1-like [Nicotiana sylvestris]|uniref:vetispiradiene synthase 1-like n=1 Tax=Nicotiana sylvestris TaxID=4096 RepID=UPI00388C7233
MFQVCYNKIFCELDHFNQFKDNSGKFKETLLKEVKGLLNLYEAAQVRKHGDEILEEAVIFTKEHLEKIAPKLSSSIIEKQLRRWWKDLDLASKLSYVRDRIVECYFWAIGVYFEPQYSRARIMLAKCVAMISVIDGTYDSYGTLDELEEWDVSEIDRLPIYMKTIYATLLDLFKEYDMDVKKQDISFHGVYFVKKAMKEIVRSYYNEAQCFIKGKSPPFEEYLSNALITGTYYLLAPASLLGMKSASKASFDWMMNKPKILVASALIGRVIDDVATYKDLNKECIIKPTNSTPFEILKPIINLTPLIDVVYKNNEDGYNNPK